MRQTVPDEAMRTDNLKKGRVGIMLRTALLSWLVTIMTLLTFVMVIIPEQKRTFLENLDSKAHGVAVSLRDVAASAVVNEDYSSVVEHCVQMLNGDKTIDHLVITRSDGFSLIHDRQRWFSETNTAPEWRPAKREAVSGIGAAPVFGRRVFTHSMPFDYSGIQWGWINVGLSLESYDKSVAAAYRRTIVLAVICTALSLLASVVYAKRLVGPIVSLRAVVQKVAEGDLSARVVIKSRDEVGSLGSSFNTMTEALCQRDQILQSVRFAAQQFLTAADWKSVIDGVLVKIGQAASVSRAYVFENSRLDSGELVSSHRFEWCAPGISPQIDNPALQNLSWAGTQFEGWANLLTNGEMMTAHVRSLNASEREFLESQQIRSLLLIPIRVGNCWWGFLGLDECTRDRSWTDAECDSIRAAADMFSAAIERQRAQDALLEAKGTLELRVKERTHELQEQMEAKEKAHAELAEAQQRLVEASRQAGMAEVATGVLHNVGNVLNSVNVSANLVLDRLRESKIANLPKLAGLLEENTMDLGRFFTSDPRGRQVPGYLNSLAKHLGEEQTFVLGELEALRKHIDHIKDIVAMQQEYAKVSGVTETVAVAQLVEDALQLNAGALARHGVKVVREFEPVPAIAVEKHKVLQVLVNLIRNAKYALEETRTGDKRLCIRIRGRAGGRVQIEVIDNGVGIPPENLTRIFSHGFTTRKGGHGFGLHSGALAAKELGGSLVAHSDGIGTGATFTLELPQSRVVGRAPMWPLPMHLEPPNHQAA